MEDRLKEFLKIETGSGYGYGSGYGDDYGYGDGSGDGYGSGSGYGDDYGYGDGSGDGYGSGSGDGDGYGDGYGSGSGYGYGYGSGYGYGMLSLDKETVCIIDKVPTIIRRIKGNIASGVIINSDFTTEKCFVIKDGNYFAHGKTLKKAMQELENKKWENMDTDVVIEKFCRKFEKGRSYKGSEFFDWHHYLTGSCLMGRESFVKNHDLNMEDEFTVDEFIRLTENDYGSKIIKQLKESWEQI